MLSLLLLASLCSAASFESAEVNEVSKSLAQVSLNEEGSALNVSHRGSVGSGVGGGDGEAKYPEYSPNSRRRMTKGKTTNNGSPPTPIKSKSAKQATNMPAISSPRSLFSNMAANFKPKPKSKSAKTGGVGGFSGGKIKFEENDSDTMAEQEVEYTSATDDEPLQPSPNDSPSAALSAVSSNSSNNSGVVSSNSSNNVVSSTSSVLTSVPLSASSPDTPVITRRKITPPPTSIPNSSLNNSTRRSRMSGSPNRSRHSNNNNNNSNDSSGSGSNSATPPPNRKHRSSKQSARKLLQSTFGNLSARASGSISSRDQPQQLVFPNPLFSLKREGSPSPSPPVTPEGGSPPSVRQTGAEEGEGDEDEDDALIPDGQELEKMVLNLDISLFAVFDGEVTTDASGLMRILFKEVVELAKPSPQLTFIIAVCLPLFLSHGQIVHMFQLASKKPSVNQVWTVYVSLFHKNVPWPQSIDPSYGLSLNELTKYRRVPCERRGFASGLLSQVSPLPRLIDHDFMNRLGGSTEQWILGLVDYYGWMRAELNPIDMVEFLYTPQCSYRPFHLITDFSRQEAELSWWIQVCDQLIQSCQLEPLIAILEGLWALYSAEKIQTITELQSLMQIYSDRDSWSGYRKLDLHWIMAVGGHSLFLTNPMNSDPLPNPNIVHWATFHRTYAACSDEDKHQKAMAYFKNK